MLSVQSLDWLCLMYASSLCLQDDNGVRCPFCRQFVEEFVPLTG